MNPTIARSTLDCQSGLQVSRATSFQEVDIQSGVFSFLKFKINLPVKKAKESTVKTGPRAKVAVDRLTGSIRLDTWPGGGAWTGMAHKSMAPVMLLGMSGKAY